MDQLQSHPCCQPNAIYSPSRIRGLKQEETQLAQADADLGRIFVATDGGYSRLLAFIRRRLIRTNHMTHSNNSLKRSSLARTFTSLAVVAIASTSCGPAIIGATVSGGGGTTSTTAPLELSRAEIGSSSIGSCGLIREVFLRVNRPNITLTYSLNDSPSQPFTDPATGLAEPAIPANVDTPRRVLFRAGSNTLVVSARSGANEVASQTLTVNIVADPIAIDLEPPSVRGQDYSSSIQRRGR